MEHFVNSGWIIIIKDFKKSEKRSDRLTLGEIDQEDEIIYLDKKRGTPKVLIHELCHFGLGTVLEKMSENLPWKDLKKTKGRCRADKEFKWREDRTLEFEEYFYFSLNKKQIRILWDFIDEARKRYKEEEG
ncbi:MAG: hypothetical protein A2915_04090 [Candidatus Yanofskybacteria bacterium RIFCSPLOWO2_01_FULL_41_34]|uniref:Uncharacterized protein n=1 Tax=Candidatus Yanofskybacteria bacterium RIFCSPHIGHO2_01_FULL_41_26 TaxID=1802661 RepID=A0A1F8EC00_9BACT|nr:MAG: hypothetical protein A2649_03190 [Candidatus Yanofskybacteria bacterium RIFCSPHIGHO2_01_FULL_41_26]OGN21590.1 MAG: hypothetical protein A2915_04090 [Candidatus Yanofskybacteria bacterium RIFCSPLOWO2_01_FULL_41_34]